MNLGFAICAASLFLSGALIIHGGDQAGGFLIGLGILTAIIGVLGATHV